MNAEELEQAYLEQMRQRQVAYSQSFESPSQMIAKIDAIIADLDKQKTMLNELIAKCYELRGAESRREK